MNRKESKSSIFFFFVLFGAKFEFTNSNSSFIYFLQNFLIGNVTDPNLPLIIHHEIKMEKNLCELVPTNGCWCLNKVEDIIPISHKIIFFFPQKMWDKLQIFPVFGKNNLQTGIS